MKNALFDKFRALVEQAFVPIFVKDSFDTETLLAGCTLAGVRVMEYTLRREDAAAVIPTLKKRFPDRVVFVGSTIDCQPIVEGMKAKYPQLMSIPELAPHVDGFVSMLPYSDETLTRYRQTHLLLPAAETSGEALRQMRAGATVIKVCGPDFSFSKQLHAAPTFSYCPTFLTGGVNLGRMDEAFAAGNILVAAGFDLILKGEDPQHLTPERVAECLLSYINTAKAARTAQQPCFAGIESLDDKAFAAALPNFTPILP